MKGSLLQLLGARAEAGRPLRVGLIGAGKFGTMFLSQARRIRGIHVLGIADLSIDRAHRALESADWPRDEGETVRFSEALRDGTTCLTTEAESLIEADGLEVVIEATGDPAAGLKHALKAFEHGRHVVMVNVEADALAGPLLARRAAAAGVVYSLGYGDQPALICEFVEWARLSGFEVVCAGKGTKYLPAYHSSTPDTVWDHYGFSEDMVARGDYNATMFNSFLDGTKSAIEMAAVANATGLVPQPGGLGFPPCGMDDLPDVCRPHVDGGALSHSGTVEVVSSIERDGTSVHPDLRWGVYVTFKGGTEYVCRCFSEYGLSTDSTGRYAAMYRPYHLVGLELAYSVVKVGLRGEPTGCPIGFQADVVARAKRDLRAGEFLDGEGGYTVYGALMPARAAVGEGGLPIGLARGVRMVSGVAKGQLVRWSDVECTEADSSVRLRHEMEQIPRDD